MDYEFDPTAAPNVGDNAEWDLVRNQHLPKNKAFTPMSALPAVEGSEINVLGHKWTTVTYYADGAEHLIMPTFGTFPNAQKVMDVISGCALAPFYACATGIPPAFDAPLNVHRRGSAFLIGDLPRLFFEKETSPIGVPLYPTNYTVTDVNPEFPGRRWEANFGGAPAPSNSASQQDWKGYNRYSWFLNNPQGDFGKPLPNGWNAPFKITNVSMQNHNGPYSFPQFGDGVGKVQFRTVSAELRIKYTGTEEDRGGLVTILEHPEHQSIVGYTLAQMQAYDVCRTEAVKANSWHSCLYSGPINDTETEFSSVPLVTPFMGIVVSGGTNLSFQVEGWANYEFTGDLVRNKIDVCADEQGGVAVATAAKVLQSKKAFTGNGKALLREANRQIAAGSGVRVFLLFFFLAYLLVEKTFCCRLPRAHWTQLCWCS